MKFKIILPIALMLLILAAGGVCAETACGDSPNPLLEEPNPEDEALSEGESDFILPEDYDEDEYYDWGDEEWDLGDEDNVNVSVSYTGTELYDTFIVKVSDMETGKPLSGVKVDLSFDPHRGDSGYYPTLKTDSDGIVKCKFIYAGKNYIAVRIDDKGYRYNLDEEEFTLKISKINVDVIADDFTVGYGAKQKYPVKIVNSKTKKPMKKAMVYLYVYTGDTSRKWYGYTDKNGIAYFSTDSLKPGVHRVVVEPYKRHFISEEVTSSITVTKTSLTLKSVSVKKSAEKLVLTAGLKKNGKPLKSKTVMFKFNGRTYKAKTSPKGVAKVTVKKSALKKLSVGERVSYGANYAKISVVKTAKVKR